MLGGFRIIPMVCPVLIAYVMSMLFFRITIPAYLRCTEFCPFVFEFYLFGALEVIKEFA